ncbi:GtrA family protein [Orbus wheelerorum]|uniref:GtrA family protein n=1 Tax=Orbus wheelerorum TaxID=3074111 RepID=UPI00370D79AC
MLKVFIKYSGVGVINTAIHWLIFLLCFYCFSLKQATSNLIAFAIAVTFSYLINSVFTFKVKYRVKNYLLYCFSMAAIAYFVGYFSDYIQLPFLLTLITFSFISLISGFYFSLLIFKRK